AVGLAQMHHHGADQSQTTTHLDTRHLATDATTAHNFPIGIPVTVKAVIMFRVGHLDINPQTNTQSKSLDASLQYRRTTHQYGKCQFLVDDDLHSTQYTFVLAFGEDDA